jgi:membrane protease YdiL (CAAX protease family)
MRGRIAALCEIVGVFILGTLLARLIARAAGISSATLRTVKTPEFFALAFSTAINLVLRYGIILALALAIGWWYRRRPLREYGITLAAIPLREHLAIAIVLFSVGGFVPRLLMFLRSHVPLGAEPPQWAQIDSAPNTLAFWVYMAVGSFALVPIVEELFARGYVQTRLGDGFGAAAAIVMTALLFAASHRQYFLASALGIGMLASLLFGSILGGYVRHRTGSLLPGILGHAFGNVPLRGLSQAIALALMLCVIVIARRVIAEHARDLVRLLRDRRVISGIAYALAAALIVLAEIAFARALLLPTAAIATIAALLLSRRASPALR